MKFELQVDPKKATKERFAVTRLLNEEGKRVCSLDVEVAPLRQLNSPPASALDFLVLSSTVYALDKMIPRETANDGWTRSFFVSVPVSDPSAWDKIKDNLEECVSFLSGEVWQFEFTQLSTKMIRPERRQRRLTLPILSGAAVSLFSGGLDSLVGAIDWLERNSPNKVLLVGHHDGQIAGPYADQRSLLEPLAANYPERISRLLVRVGHSEKATEITLRCRSLLFIALGLYAAAAQGDKIPLVVPENGTIALNVPLTPSRRGSCSTRTAHPYYLDQLTKVLTGIGLTNPIITPFSELTKGEVVSNCANFKLLSTITPLSVSCAKRGHKRWWQNRKAKACGRCMPCIYRRAALHAVGLDNDLYGFDICQGEGKTGEKEAGFNDLRACLSFLRQRPSNEQIGRLLLSSGKLDIHKLSTYSDLVQRAMNEIRQLFRDKAVPEIKRRAGLLSSQ